MVSQVRSMSRHTVIDAPSRNGKPELNQQDGIHPTAQGYDVVVQNVWKVLGPLLK